MHVAVNAFFWDRPDTGSGQYLKNLVRTLKEVEPDITLTLVAPQSLNIGDEFSPGFRWHQTPHRKGNVGKLWFEQVDFPRACRQLGTDIAHIPYWGPPLQSPVPTAVTIHDLIPLLLREYRGGLLTRLYTSLVAAATRGTNSIITDSHSSKADIVTHLNIPETKIRVVHLAAGKHFHPTSADPSILSKYRLPDSYFLYLGGFDVRKNLPALLRAYTYVGRSIGDDYPLVLAGRIPDHPSVRFTNVKKLIGELGIEEWVHLVGFVDEDDKPDIYRGATAVIQLSRYEGFGLPPLEAMACGTPVVVSNASSLPEVVGPAGFAIDPDDIEGIAGAMIACAIQNDLHNDLRQKGLEQASRFSWEKTARQTAHAYREVLLSNPKRT